MLTAAGTLYEVRLDLLRTLLNEPKPDWMNQAATELPDEYVFFLAESFWRDLRGLAHCTYWLNEATLPLPMRPGRQLLRHLPAPQELLHRNSRGSTAKQSLLNRAISDEWETEE